MKTAFIAFMVILLVYFTPLFSKNKKVIQFEIPDSTQIQIITVKDGSTFDGRIVEIDNGEIKFETKYGLLIFPVEDITELKVVSIAQLKKENTGFPIPIAHVCFLHQLPEWSKRVKVILQITSFSSQP